MKSLFYTAALILGLLATLELLRRAWHRSGRHRTIAAAGLSSAAMAFATIGIAFADPLIVKPVARATVVGLATFISDIAVIGLLVSVLALLAWWILQGTWYRAALTALTGVAAAAVGSMTCLFAQSATASRYAGTSLRLLVADASAGGRIDGRSVAYACIYFAFVALASVVSISGFTYLALGARDLGCRVCYGFSASAVAGGFGLLYAILSLVAVISGAHHRLILPFNGTETGTAFAVCGVLIFAAGLLIPHPPRRQPTS